MREIKFRIWDYENKRFDYIELSNKNCGCGWKQNDKTIFQEFTGLYDKHKKPIYEGDIIEIEEPEFESAVISAEIKFSRGAFMYWWREEKRGFPMDMTNSKDVKIIGNIYENK